MESSPATFRQQQLHQHGADLDTEGHASLFWWQGRQAAVITDHNGLLLEQIRPAGGCLPSWCSPRADDDSSSSSGRMQYVPFSEILCARYLPIRRYCSSFSSCQRQRHYAELQVLQRDPARPWQWSLKSVELAAEQPAMVKAWVGQVRQRLQQLTYRPQQLLVFVNPFGGKRRARRTWQAVAAPILAAAGVDCQVVETAYQGHAEAAVKALTLEQLQALDGLVAVGGDGLFSELLTAVLTHSHLGAALQLRLGHIPAGSTDAVACTLHGTRDPTTAALHIALGDCTALDVGRMVTLPEGSATPTAAAAAVASAAAAGLGSNSNGPLQQQSGAGALSNHVQQQPQAAPGLYYGFTSVGSYTELLRGGVNAERSEQQASIAAGGGAAALPPSPLGKHAGTSSSKHAGRQQRRWQQQQRRQGEGSQQQQPRGPAPQQQQGSDGVSVFVPQLRHFVCVANFGFLGDVMELSERLRWAGPIRYDIAGVLRFLMLRHYKATVWYKPAPSTAQAAAGAGAADAAAQPSQQQQRWRPEDAVVSPAAVAPLPHHQAPALHAKMLGAAAAPADWRQQLPWCVGGPGSHCSSDSGSSRRSSLDGSAPCSGPLHTVAAESPPPAAGGRGGGSSGGRQQQQAPKSVSFMPQVAAVHVSAASFSSRGSALPGVNSAAAAAAASRASSVTSGGSGSRCHSRCSRCTAAALHHSSSRQSFTHIHSLGGEPPAAAPDADAVAADNGAHTLPPAGGARTAAAAVDADAGASPPAPTRTAGSSPPSSPAPGSPPGDGWVKVEGRFASIMCVVTSCISDKSRAGLVPEAHLADGRLALVMVEDCSRLQYLRFLVQLASCGIVPGSLPFVRVEYATHVQVESEGGASSSWNVDGELLRHGRVNVGVHAGLVDVFARGVELM